MRVCTERIKRKTWLKGKKIQFGNNGRGENVEIQDFYNLGNWGICGKTSSWDVLCKELKCWYGNLNVIVLDTCEITTEVSWIVLIILISKGWTQTVNLGGKKCWSGARVSRKKIGDLKDVLLQSQGVWHPGAAGIQVKFIDWERLQNFRPGFQPGWPQVIPNLTTKRTGFFSKTFREVVLYQLRWRLLRLGQAGVQCASKMGICSRVE